MYKTKTAIRCFTIGLSIDPYNDDAFCNYGLALVDNGSHEAAERAFICSLNTNTQNPEAYTNLGNVMMSK